MEVRVGSFSSVEDTIRKERIHIKECRESGHSRHDLSRKILVLNVYLHAEGARRGTSEINHHSSQTLPTEPQNSLLSHRKRG